MAVPEVSEIARSDLLALIKPDEAHITDVQQLASYNWIEAKTPTIAVPGSPAAWSNVQQPKRVRKDHGLIYIAQNAARHPDYLLEPLLRAINIEQPDFGMRTVDIVSDRNNIRKLLSFIDPATNKDGLEPFTIKAEVVGQTAIFCRDEAKVTEYLGPNDFKGFGHEFEKAYTKDEIPRSTGHHRIVSYRFGDVKMIIRHETDGYVKPSANDISSLMQDLSINKPDKASPTTFPGSKLTVKQVGRPVPLSSTLEVKTRVSHKPLPMEEVAAQLWISQTPKLVRAYHNKGVFNVPEVEDTTSHIKTWEETNQDNLRTLAALMKKIVDLAKPYGKAVITYSEGDGKLKIVKTEAKDMLPEDVYKRWEEAETLKTPDCEDKDGEDVASTKDESSEAGPKFP